MAEAEKEEADIQLVKSTLLVMLRRIDKDGSGEISKERCEDVSLSLYFSARHSFLIGFSP